MINFDSILFNIDINRSIMPGPGSLLVAEPFLREEYFHHAVIQLIEYVPGGKAMGVVMNRKTGHMLQSLIDGVNVETPIPVYCGGPLSCDRLFFVHTLGDLIPECQPLGDSGLYISGDFHVMLDYINSGYPVDGYIRFFVGYSGWSVGQLDEELSNKVWAVTDVKSPMAALTLSEDRYWHQVVKLLGPAYRGWQYHPRNVHAN